MKEFPFDGAHSTRRVQGLGRWLERLQRLRERVARLAARPVVAEIKDLKNMTLRALRELAENVVGPEHARFQTRSELITAILAATGRKAAPGKAGGPEGAGDEHAWEKGPGSPEKAHEPRPEGLLVARVAGEKAVHTAPHALTEDHLDLPPEEEIEEELEAEGLAEEPTAATAPVPWDEGLGELPWSYEDDAVVALARDPETLWIYWDFAHPTVQAALQGVENPHAKLRIFEQGRLIRELDFALESRSFYVNFLVPGRHYRAEIFFVGSNGVQQRVGKPSNSIGLPPRGPSPVMDDRFATLPWGIPLTRRDLFARAEPGAGFPDTERDALFSASSAGRPLGASETAPDTGRGQYASGGGQASGRPWSGSRYEGA